MSHQETEPGIEPRHLKRFRIFYDEPDVVFELLKSFYSIPDAESTADTAIRQIFYCNSLSHILAQIHHYPDSQIDIFSALVDYIEKTNSLEGLESVFLTLIGSSKVVEDEKLVKRGVGAWLKTAKTVTVTPVSPAVYYNSTKDILFFISPETVTKIKGGGFTDPVDPSYEWLFESEREATAIIENPFSLNGGKLTKKAALTASNNVLFQFRISSLTSHQEMQQLREEVWVEGLGVAGMGVAAVGEGIALFPGGQVVGAGVVVVGGAMITAAGVGGWLLKLQRLNAMESQESERVAWNPDRYGVIIVGEDGSVGIQGWVTHEDS